MTPTRHPAVSTAPHPTTPVRHRSGRRLLTCGILAGPVLLGVGFVVAMASWTAATVVLARAFATRGDRVRTAACVAALVAAAAVAAVPSPGSFGVRAMVLSAVQLAAVALLCARALRDPAPSV